MSGQAIIFFLFFCAAAFVLILCFRQTLSRSGMRKEISGITRELKKILDEDRDSSFDGFYGQKGNDGAGGAD